MKLDTAIACLCLVGLVQGDLLNIWQTIEKPLENIGEAFLGSVLKHNIAPVLGVFERRDLSRLAISLKDEVMKWMHEAKAHVEAEMAEMEAARDSPEGYFSDRIHELLHKLDLATEHGSVEKFVREYGMDIIKQFALILPKRLETKVLSMTKQVERQTRGKDILIQMLKNITVAHWFFTMPEMERKFLVAMLDAAEYGHLHGFVEHHSFDRVLLFLDHLPSEEGHKLNHYISKHLQSEQHHNTTAAHKPAKRDVKEFLAILQEIYSEHIYDLLGRQDRIFLLELMDHAEHGNLTSFIADQGMERVNGFIEVIPKESGDKLSKFIADHLTKETEASVSHGSHHHGKRNADILLIILRDIHTADIFFHLPESERKFLLELMDAAENNKLDDFVHKVTIHRVRHFINHLPKQYADLMTQYVKNHLHHHVTTTTAAPKSGHLKSEMTTDNPKIQPRKRLETIYEILHHVGEHVHQHPNHYSQHHRDFYFQLKHAAENKILKEFINKVGKDSLFSFLKALPDQYATTLEQRILKELEEEDKVIPTLSKRQHHGHGNIHETLHHVGEHLTEHHNQYSINIHQFYAELQQAVNNHQLKAFIARVGTEELYAFLNVLSSEFSKNLETHILQELEKEDHVETL